MTTPTLTMHPIDQAIATMQQRNRARTCVTLRMADLARLETDALKHLAAQRGLHSTHWTRATLIISLFQSETGSTPGIAAEIQCCDRGQHAT